MDDTIFSILVKISTQQMQLYEHQRLIRSYTISTAKNGPGERINSEMTPRGWHVVRAKIGAGCPVNTVFIRRRPTGEIFSSLLREDNPHRDWILTRILWLSGLEVGKNRLGDVDTMRRYIYIHGCPDDVQMGSPGSRGCIRMKNDDLIELFDSVPAGTRLLVQE